MTWRHIIPLVLIGAGAACGNPAAPPDPSSLRARLKDPQRHEQITSITIEHEAHGSMGEHGVAGVTYRVSIDRWGRFDFEGNSTGMPRHFSGGLDRRDVEAAFAWVADHSDVLLPSSANYADDVERVVYRIQPRDGPMIVIEANHDYEIDDLWVLSSIVDEVVARALLH